MQLDAVLQRLQALGSTHSVEEAARLKITSATIYHVSMPKLHAFAKEIGRNHPLALELWATGIHDARVLAGMIADPAQLDETLLETWVRDFDNWAVVDSVCEVFAATPLVQDKIQQWTQREEEFVKRAGFVLMVMLAVHDKKAPDSTFLAFLPIIQREAHDGRNFVKKAVNWALRQIGKRNLALNAAAIATAQTIQQQDHKTAHWIASDALRELQSAAIQTRLQKKAQKSG